MALIDNQIDQTTGTIRVKATLPNKQRLLWPGEFVSVRVLAQVQHQALTIPVSALERGPDGLFAYVVKPDSTIEVRAAHGRRADRTSVAVIEKGLKVGDRVVTSNQYRLQPGSHVRVNGAKPATAGGAPEAAP